MKDDCGQIRLITRITAAACLLSMLLCYKLWLSDRTFPLSPVIDGLRLPNSISIILFCIFILLLSIVAFIRVPRKFIFALLGLGLLLAFLDMNRWQPWFYQYLMMFLVVAFFSFRCDNDAKMKNILNLFRVMIAGIYFWSGLQKMNPNFPADTFPWLMEPITNHMGTGSISKFHWLAYVFPLIETATGIGLLIPRMRKPALISVTVMHSFILFSLGPFGHNYNPVVWPWNVAMVAFCFILFRGKKMNLDSLKGMMRPLQHKAVFLIFVMMPLFNFFNLWDSYLSHNLYSGNTSNGVIYISDATEQQLPAYIRPYSIGEMNQNQVTIKYWCMKELGVPAYPEKRNFQAVANTFFQYASDSSEVYFLFTPKLKLADL